MAIYAMYVTNDSMHDLRWFFYNLCAFRGLVISQMLKGGFRFRNVDELDQHGVSTAEGSSYSAAEKQPYDEKGGERVSGEPPELL